MRDEYAVEIVFAFTDRVETCDEFFAAQASVDEDARAFGGNECGVAGTTARENADLYYRDLPLSILNILSRENKRIL